MTIVKRTVRGIAYYYLQHTIRTNGGFTQKSKYLGRKIPKDIARVESKFIHQLNKERWFDRFDEIRGHYRREFSELPKSAQMERLREFSVRFTYNSQRIEGSTLTLRETANLLEHGISPNSKPRADVQEAEAHNRLFLSMLKEKRGLSLQLVQGWNWELLKETKPDIAGQVRKHGVRISASDFIPPAPVELQPMLRDFFGWYQRSKTELHPVELAALVHLRFVTIHPFGDGNGRVSRLMMNFVLNRNHYPMLNIEYKNRNSYYRALERSQTLQDDHIFASWFFRRYLRQHQAYARHRATPD